jgi:nitrogen-specific signal transduction histidine kinase
VVAIHEPSLGAESEEQLRQSQKMEALGMLAGGIAHDFNNLLTIISGYSQMLQSTRPGAELDRGALNEVLKACEHAAGLTAQLLAFSRRQPLQPRVIEINRVLNETAVLLRRLIGEQIDLVIQPGPDAGCAYADPVQLRQVILNLAINARDAMPQGGSLVIQTRKSEGSEAQPGSYAVLELTDTGTGMDEATRSRLFQPFFTTKAPGKGSGIGLATVQRIVRDLNGMIEVASEPGRGASFRVSLPRVADIVPDEEAKKPELPDPLGGHETVLIAEDDEGVRSITRRALERRGYQVISAADGAEAIAAERAWEGPIDLLIADMVMPGISGKALAETLRKRRPGLAAVFISGYPGETDGEDSFLGKPFVPAELTAKVREVLDRARKASGSESISTARC